MQAFVEEDRPDGWSNQKTCAAQFDKLMNELGVDKRPKRNEPADATRNIYKKMVERRIGELEEKAKEYRKKWLKLCKELEATEKVAQTEIKIEKVEQSPQLQTRQQQKNKSAAAAAAAASSTTSEPEKPSTRALTRRESSRQNLEKSLTVLYKEASEIPAINQLSRPGPDVEKLLGSYDRFILKPLDITSIKDLLAGEVEDPHAVMNDFLLLFQNATMYYPTDHPTYKLAIDLREKLVPQWEKLIERTTK